MTNNLSISQTILPYPLIVGQKKLKLALELAYIAPRIGGVLLSGQRGTGKSTAVRAFAVMMHGALPVTLPINATEDRVVGGLDIDQLMQTKKQWKPGLLEEANGSFLYIDEVNLLDDHLVNIILDVTSTGVLVVERDGEKREKAVRFNLVSTMNPEEGGLRPQLLDRFGLMVDVTTQSRQDDRINILKTVMAWDKAISHAAENGAADYIKQAHQKADQYKQVLEVAKQKFTAISLSDEAIANCVKLTEAFGSEGNRGDYIIALAAQAYAALEGAETVVDQHIQAVTELVLHHRRPEFLQSSQLHWTEEEDQKVKKILNIEA